MWKREDEGLPSPPDPMPRGLSNASGRNFCFLNVVVQCLWHLDAFRAKFGGGNGNSMAKGAREKKPQASEEPSGLVESALRLLLRKFPGGGTGATGTSVEALRVALSKVPGARFSLSKMEDAAEALEVILGCLVQGANAAVIREVFTMRIREVVTCPMCGISSSEVPTTYETNVFHAHMSALEEARKKDSVCSFDEALREASHGDLLTCGNADCHLAQRRERLPSRRSIMGELPSVFSFGLIWSNWRPGLVADLLEMLSPIVDLDVVFGERSKKRGGGSVPGMAWPLEGDASVGKAYLKIFYCFQVQKHHYVAFVYNKGRGEWLLLDDDQVVPIGPEFSDVRARCTEDKLHPCIFFYERQHPLA